MKYLLLLLLLGCSTQQMPSVDADGLYKKDMAIRYNGSEYIGGAILPTATKYELHFIAKGELNLFDFSNCHRSETSEDTWLTEKKRTFIFKRTKEIKKEIKVTYTPTLIERPPCPVFVTALEEEKKRHSWAFIDFEDSSHKLPATLVCDGETRLVNGVSWCQSKAGLIQRIIFGKIAKVSPDAQCDIGQKEGTVFDFNIKRGLCVYVFMTADKQLHRLTTYGFDSVLLRK